ncbi:MAG TPA: response regulator transcription factor [Terriglobales bacterium]|nr:response regulator transcription factor [Terriglobales bacterium]
MSTSKRRLNLLLIDDHMLFREGLARLLAAEDDFTLVAHCSTGVEGLAALRQNPVDVVLLDYDLGETRGTDVLSQIRAISPQTKVLMLTAGISEMVSKQVISMGASGIFLKHRSPTELGSCIRQVMEGWSWLDQQHLRAIFSDAPAEPVPQKPRFTQREREVLRGVFEGLANKEIAARLNTSEAAIKSVLQQLFDKTGVRTRTQLVRLAIEHYSEELR